ncbi:hypothetical protein FACS1894203_4340 [Bacteroidia bacterium]|nr:hypothetical protein FACS1894203_4340 [Bacteroidia bacterium]
MFVNYEEMIYFPKFMIVKEKIMPKISEQIFGMIFSDFKKKHYICEISYGLEVLGSNREYTIINTMQLTFSNLSNSILTKFNILNLVDSLFMLERERERERERETLT